MWKWVGGILLVVLVCFVAASWYGYRTLTAGGDSVSITIGAPPERVFAALADHDSLAAWRLARRASPMRHGPMRPGDTVRLDAAQSGGRSRGLTWVATDVDRNKLLAVALQNDSTGQTI